MTAVAVSGAHPSPYRNYIRSTLPTYGSSKKWASDDEREEQGIFCCVRLLACMVIFVVLVTIAGLIVGICILAKEDNDDNDRYYPDDSYYKGYYDRDDSSGEDDYYRPTPCSYCDKERIYVIGVGSSFGTSDRLSDDEDGELCRYNGWNEAIINGSCRAAGIRCKIMVTPYRDCVANPTLANYREHSRLGPGLYSRNLDACAGWFATTERDNYAAFSDPYITRDEYHLYMIPTLGAPDNVEDAVIGFVYPQPGDEKCIRRYLVGRLNLNIDDANLIPFASPSDLLDAVADLGSPVNLAFTSERNAYLFGNGNFGDFEIYDTDADGSASEDDLEDTMLCSRQGAGLMAHKGNYKFLSWFNKGLAKFIASGGYREVCDDPFYNTFDPTEEHRTWCYDEGQAIGKK